MYKLSQLIANVSSQKEVYEQNLLSNKECSSFVQLLKYSVKIYIFLGKHIDSNILHFHQNKLRLANKSLYLLCRDKGLYHLPPLTTLKEKIVH